MAQKKALFNRLNHFFDHIYLITLKRSKERHIYTKKTLKGLDYEIFWGVDGSELDLNNIQQEGLYDPEQAKKKIPIGSELKSGEIGCALSHNNIYQDIIEKGYDCALILEDDVIVDAENVHFLYESLNELPSDWDLLYLGYLYNNDRITLPIQLWIHIAYPILTMLGYKKYNTKRIRCKYPRPYSEHLELSGYHYGTHAYAVSQSGAKKILLAQTPVTMAPDNAIGMMCMLESIKAFRVRKRFFHQNRKVLPTTIDERW